MVLIEKNVQMLTIIIFIQVFDPKRIFAAILIICTFNLK